MSSNEEERRDIGSPLPVLIYIEPGRMTLPDTEASVVALDKDIIESVSHGLRASLETGSLITGAKYVNIDYFLGEEKLEVGKWQGYTTIPTIGTGFGQIEVKVNRLLDKFNRLPIETTVANANAAIAQLDETLKGIRAITEDPSTTAIPAEVGATMADLRAILHNPDINLLPGELAHTLAELQATLRGLSPNSPFYKNLNSTLQQLNRTLVNVESLTRTLSVKPNSAIMPSTLPVDPVPEASPQ